MEEKVIIKTTYPLGEFNCQDFPEIPGKGYAISQEELDKLREHELKWSEDEDGHTILIPNDPTDENARNEALRTIAELKDKLAKTDYQAIKFAEGELSEKDYAPIREERKAWRAEINQKEALLKGE